MVFFCKAGLSQTWSPSLCRYLRLYQPRYRTFNLVLLLTCAHSLSLSGFLCVPSFPSIVSAWNQPCWGCTRSHWLLKISSPYLDPWGIHALIIGFHSDTEPLTRIFRMRPPSQFLSNAWSTLQILNSPIQRQGFWYGVVSKAFQKWMTPVTFPLSTGAVSVMKGHQIGQETWLKSFCLSPIRSLSSICLNIELRRICSTVFPGTALRLTGV